MEVVTIPKHYHGEDVPDITTKGKVILNPGLTILIGCNGSGKTTLISMIKEHCDEKDIPYISYDNYSMGGHTAKRTYLDLGDMESLATAAMSSEGEEIMVNLGNFASKMGRFVNKHVALKTKELFIFIDGLGSGMSLDCLRDVKKSLFSLVLDNCADSGIQLYLIVSTNMYELAKDERCLDVSTMLYHEPKCYEDYETLVLNTRRIKDFRYNYVGD